jgi:hypothetical protein
MVNPSVVAVSEPRMTGMVPGIRRRQMVAQLLRSEGEHGIGGIGCDV